MAGSAAAVTGTTVVNQGSRLEVAAPPTEMPTVAVDWPV